MADRIHVYVGEPLARLLDGAENRSGRLNTLAERYLEIVRRDVPELAEAEWCALCDALDGYWMEGAPEPGLRFAWASIADADRLDGLGDKWGVDAQALAARVRDLPTGALVALAEVVERFWRLQPSGRTAREDLEAAGAWIARGAGKQHQAAEAEADV